MADLAIEIVYALAHAQTVLRISVAPGTTVQDAVERSGIRPEGPFDPSASYGIFGRRVAPTQRLVDGDRIEIYRPLQVDPRLARRRRAKPSRRSAR